MALLRDQPGSKMADKYSSFKIVETTLGEIIPKLLKSQRLMKLLYYTDKHAVSGPDLTQEQIFSMLDDQIRIVPKVPVSTKLKPSVLIAFEKFVPQENQTTFRDVLFSIHILCPYDLWTLDDFKLRPYSIAGEIDTILNHSTILKTGFADFVGANKMLLNDDLGGVTLYYKVDAMTDDLQLH